MAEWLIISPLNTESHPGSSIWFFFFPHLKYVSYTGIKAQMFILFHQNPTVGQNRLLLNKTSGHQFGIKHSLKV